MFSSVMGIIPIILLFLLLGSYILARIWIFTRCHLKAKVIFSTITMFFMILAIIDYVLFETQK